jgi:type I restriction enzyme R subunit
MQLASFIDLTGTPVVSTKANTQAIFGDYTSIYDIQRAVVGETGVSMQQADRSPPEISAPQEEG